MNGLDGETRKEKAAGGPDRIKRAAVLQDLAGFGKCALTIVLPVLSAAGVECCPIPTAVLSSHTGGLPGCVSRDLTEEIPGFIRQWEALGLRFDALYSGYLSSPEQGKAAEEAFRRLRGENTLILVDPVMGDGGTLYRNIQGETATAMHRLCTAADIITPNLTEAAFLLNRPYPGSCGSRQAEEWTRELCGLGPRQSILTGVCGENGQLGAAAYDRETNTFYTAFAPREPGNFHGTGDLFSSVLLSSLLLARSLPESLSIAVEFTALCIRRTLERKLDPLYGVAMEDCLPELIRVLRPECWSA